MLLSEPFTAPLAHVGLTCGIYVAALEVSRRSGNHPLANPVLLSVCCLIAVLWSARIDYEQYFSKVQLIHFLLGPATVALAVPLFRHRQKVRQAVLPIAGGILCGSAAGITTTLAICLLAGID